MDELFLLLGGFPLNGTDQLCNAGFHGFLVFLDLVFIEEILREEFHVAGVLIESVGESGDVENFGMIQTQFEEDIR